MGINLGPSPRYAVLVSLVLNLKTTIVSPQFHLSYDNFFETVRPTVGNPPVYSCYQALTGLRKHKHPVRDPKSTPTKRVERPKTNIIRDSPAPPSEERAEELPMEDFPEIEEETPTSEGDSIPLPLQLPLQEVTVEYPALT